uniref:Uncharacterized protein n=1 Tax=Plectus sambesii TaxID=2011161 RepID=A0A914V2A1_9BILA
MSSDGSLHQLREKFLASSNNSNWEPLNAPETPEFDYRKEVSRLHEAFHLDWRKMVKDDASPVQPYLSLIPELEGELEAWKLEWQGAIRDLVDKNLAAYQ